MAFFLRTEPHHFKSADDDSVTRNCAIVFGEPDGDGSHSGLFPAGSPSLRDLDTRTDLGVFAYTYTRALVPHDAFMVKVLPWQTRAHSGP